MRNFLFALIGLILTFSLLASSTNPDAENQRLFSLLSWPSKTTKETGRGVIIAIIDSGANRLEQFHHFSKWNFIAETSDIYDKDGHGTAICGILALLAPGALIMPLLVTHDGAATNEHVIDAIVYAITHGAKVINLSLSISEYIFDAAINALGIEQFSNTLFVVAAGNNGKKLTLNYHLDNVIVVGATTLNPPLRLASYSEFGEHVDIAAPAGDIYDGITTLDARSQSTRLFNGTSSATAVVSAALALALEKYSLISPKTLKELLLTKSTHIDSLNVASGRLVNIKKLLSDFP